MSDPRPWYVGNNGATNFTRSEAQQFARGILQSDDYRNSLKSRAKTGTLPPQVETMLWHYAYGKPVEQLNVTNSSGLDLSQMGSAELADIATRLADAMREAKEVEDLLAATQTPAPSTSSSQMNVQQQSPQSPTYRTH